jgi:hypothetical protein
VKGWLLGCLLAFATFAQAVPTGGVVSNDWTPPPAQTADGATLIELGMVRCAIPQLEKELLPLRAEKAADCERLNRATRVVREPGLKRLRVKKGKYVFRVKNVDVAWPVDFQVKGELDKSLPVTQGGVLLKQGEVVDYPITLTPGVYVVASPLNATYPYSLLVEE